MTLRRGARSFVGRAEQLDRLEQALRSAQQGTPTTVLIGGEAGVGKTRLIGEFTPRARDRGALVLEGACLELGEEGLPYAAVSEALRDLSDEVGGAQLRRLAGEDLADLARVVPVLRGEQPGAASGGDGHVSAPSQLRLFEAVLRLVGRLADGVPVVLVLEDVHWADASTRDLLVFLAHNLREVGVVLVTSFRADELYRTHPLRGVLAQLSRQERVERIDLAPFGREEMAQLLEDLLGEPPAAGQLEAMVERCQGNPFFAEELLAAGGELAELPEYLRDILLATIDRLPPEAFEVLRAIAAAGGEASHSLVVRVVSLDAGTLNDALRTAVQRGVLVTHPTAEAYTFRHALLTEAVYSTLLPGEVEDLHRLLADAIGAEATLAVRSTAAELAHHWHRAQDQPRSLAASIEAAREAESAAGIVEARTHVERALSLWSRVEDAERRSGMAHLDVLRWAAELALAAGDPDRAVALLERALTTADVDLTTCGLLHQRLSIFKVAAGDVDGAEQACAEAVRLIPGDPPTPERAQALATYSTYLMQSTRVRDAEPYARSALEMARATGDRRVEADALVSLGIVLAHQRDERGFELLGEGRALGEELGGHEPVQRSYRHEAFARHCLADYDAAIAVASAGIDRARESGAGGFSLVALTGPLVWAAIRTGRWELADDALRDAPRETGGRFAGGVDLCRALLAARRGQIEIARTALDAARGHRIPQVDQHYQLIRVTLVRLEGDSAGIDTAIAERPAIPNPLTKGTIVALLAVELHATLLGALADRVPPHRDGQETAETLLAECHELADRLDPQIGPLPAWVALAEAEHARATGADDAVERWATAVERCDELSLVYHAADARYRLAQALLDHDRRDEATPPLQAAAAVARKLGAAPLERDVVDLARRARIDLDDQRPADGTGDGLGLTPRETEVLTLLADGRSNPEIAERLFISPKTASVHVSNILRKLEVDSRGEATALAHRRGLTR